MISLDTETTGVDFRHGARPFFVTVCYENGTQRFWEWDVDPLTRQVAVPVKDLLDIKVILKRVSNWLKFDEKTREREVLVMQNGKFDVTALRFIGIEDFPWLAVRDTLLAGHLLSSNTRHDLTSMCLEIGLPIQKYEDALEKACIEARGIARKHFKKWQIAREGLETMPSVKGSKSEIRKGRGAEKDKNWKYDSWLPRAVAKEMSYPDGHPWWTVLADYANADSAATLLLWKYQHSQIVGRKLEKLYKARLDLLPVAFNMESSGVSVNGNKLFSVERDFREQSEVLDAEMTIIADSYGYDLALPRNGVNNNLRAFVFDVLKLPPHYNPKSKTGAPAMNKDAIAYWQAVLETDSDGRRFIELLEDKRAYDTALSFTTSYQRFWVAQKENENWYRLHSSYNPTGTDTLRGSMANPNGQQISKKKRANLRQCFAPGPGREFWSLDAKNIELRIPFYKCGEEALIDLFERSDEPPFYGSQHLLNFSIVYPEIWEDAVRKIGLEGAGSYCKTEYEATYYQWVKNGDFAIQYNCGVATADRSFHREGAFYALKSRFSRLEALNKQCIGEAQKKGYVETFPDTSIDPERGYPLLCSRGEDGRIVPTTPLAYKVSGTACWWMQMAMIRSEDQLQEWRNTLRPWNGFVALQIHDELLFDFPRGIGPEPWRTNLPKIRRIQKLMERGGEDIGVPTPVTVEYHAEDWSKSLVI
jgi:DNA polymerase I-like protein with 3'-5' exonuclease and polymerase domains